MKLTERELATVLAALRFWRQNLEEEIALADREGRDPIIISEEHFSDVDPLDPGEIDGLCDRLKGKGGAS